MTRVVRALLIFVLACAVWGVYEARARVAQAAPQGVALTRLKASLASVPMTLPNSTFRGTADAVPDWIVERSGAEAYASIVYRNPAGEEVRLYIGGSVSASGYFHKPDRCLPSQGWDLLEDSKVPFTAYPADSAAPEMRRLLLKQGRSERLLVYFWYQSGARVSPNDWSSSWFRFMKLVQNRVADATYIVTLYSPVVGTVADTEKRTQGLLQALGPALRTSLANGD